MRHLEAALASTMTRCSGEREVNDAKTYTGDEKAKVRI